MKSWLVTVGAYRFVIQADTQTDAAAELGRRLLTLNVANITETEVAA